MLSKFTKTGIVCPECGAEQVASTPFAHRDPRTGELIGISEYAITYMYEIFHEETCSHYNLGRYREEVYDCNRKLVKGMDA